MDLEKHTILVFTVVLACVCTVTGGFFGCDDPEEADVDIFIRSYENKTCGIFHVLFPKTYKLNETTTCRCTKKHRVTCRNVVIVNNSTNTTADIVRAGNEGLTTQLGLQPVSPPGDGQDQPEQPLGLGPPDFDNESLEEPDDFEGLGNDMDEDS